MTSLTVTMASKTSSVAKTEKLIQIPKCNTNGSKLLSTIKTKVSVVPITDIRTKCATKSTTSYENGSSIAITTTPTADNGIEKETKCSSLMRIRESKLRTELKNDAHADAKVQSTHNANVRGSSEGKIVDMVGSLQNIFSEDTYELLPTGRISREKKVKQDSQPNSALEKVQKRDLSFVRKNKLNIKTDANAQNDKNLDTGTDLTDAPLNNYICVDANGCVNGLTAKCDGITINGGEGVAEELNVSKENKSTATTTETVATPVRPITLVTGNQSFPIATQTSPVAKSTPKTPNTTPQHHDPTQPKSTLHNSIHRKHQHISPEVPRTTTSFTKLTPKTPPVTPDSPATYLDDDLDSIYSFATTTSGRSTMSCEHSYVAHNGTTFSGRKNKFVIHNSQYAGLVGTAYVTPTQRAQNQIRKLKALLHAMQQDINQKNDEILRLTREVAELRLFKASLNSPEERSASSDAVTVREAELQTSQDVSPIVDMVDDATKSSSPRHLANTSGLTHNYQSYLQQQQSVMQLSSDMQSSFADSGHFEDMTSMSVHSKDSYAGNTHDGIDDDNATAAHGGGVASAVAAAEREVEVQRQELIRMYEQRIEELIRNQDAASTEMKRIHNDKVEALLQKLSECNTRYADIVPDYEMAKERIRELEGQLEDLQLKLFDHEEKQNKMYLHMYQKGQEAERIARADQALELAYRAPSNRVSINELLHQLQSTQDELENIRVRSFKFLLIFLSVAFLNLFAFGTKFN